MSTVVSIEIKPEQIIIAEGQHSKGKVTVTRTAAASLPRGAFSDSEIRDEAVVKESLQSLLKGSRIRSKKAVVTLDIGNMLVRDFDIPAGKPAEMAGMVRTEMIQNFSAAESDVIQFTQVGKEESIAKVRATAVNRQVVDGFHGLLKSVGLRPYVMDSNANCIEKLMLFCTGINGRGKEGDPFAVLDFSTSGTVLHAVNRGEVQLSRYTALGLMEMNTFIAEKFNDFGGAGSYLDKIDFTREEDATDSNVTRHALSFMDQWCMEIQKVIKYVLLRMDAAKIEQVYLTGEACSIPGIEEVIRRKLMENSEILASLSNVQFRNPADNGSLFRSIHAIGAMIRL